AIADGRKVLALNAATGDLLWHRDTYSTVGDSPLVLEKTIITATRDREASRLWAFDREGNLQWLNTVGSYTDLAATDGFLAVAQGPVVTLIRTSDGEPVHYWLLGDAPEDIELVRQGNQLLLKTETGVLVSATY
ncbi:MAG: PQQ-like beta-propeller repeat protein, partial [Turneriella sp.]|nr:PQQ-like beta-propeller repeat protein [Turneriella sp.]